MNIAALLPTAMSGETAVEIAAGVLNFLALLALYRAFAPSGSVNARARSHAKRRSELRATLLTPARAARRKKSVTAVRGLLERLKLTHGEEVKKASELLAQGGWRAPDALTMPSDPALANILNHLTQAKILTALLIERLITEARCFSPWGYELGAAGKRQSVA